VTIRDMLTTLTTADIFAPIQSGLSAVEAKLREASLDNQHPALTSALEHLLASGGKRVRPATALLAARLFDAAPAQAVCLGAALEMLHTATLVHDDLIDGSLLRRGLPTLNAQWTPGATVLTGDFLFARAAELAAETDSVRVMSVFARTLMVIVNGEINQMFVGRGQASRAGYLERIYAKTASLFAAAAEAGAILGDANDRAIDAMRVFGSEMGMAFQIVDDVLDFTADQERLGKPVGSDFRAGKITYPLIHCWREGSEADREVLRALAARPSMEDADLDEVRQMVERYGAVKATMAVVDEYLGRARAHLAAAPDTPARRSLAFAIDFVRERDW